MARMKEWGAEIAQLIWGTYGFMAPSVAKKYATDALMRKHGFEDREWVEGEVQKVIDNPEVYRIMASQ